MYFSPGIFRMSRAESTPSFFALDCAVSDSFIPTIETMNHTKDLIAQLLDWS